MCFFFKHTYNATIYLFTNELPSHIFTDVNHRCNVNQPTQKSGYVKSPIHAAFVRNTLRQYTQFVQMVQNLWIHMRIDMKTVCR